MKKSIIIVSILVLLVIYFLTFVIIRPFDNMIVEDRPIMEMLCEMQARCNSVNISWSCDGIDQAIQEGQPVKGWKHKKIANWKGYKGCNESSQGFIGNNIILKESCSCGGLM